MLIAGYGKISWKQNDEMMSSKLSLCVTETKIGSGSRDHPSLRSS